MLRDHIFDTIARNLCRAAVFQTFENFSVSLKVLLSCNLKGLVFDFHLNRKRNKCWLVAYSWHLFISVSLQLFRQRLSLESVKAYATMSIGIVGSKSLALLY